MDAMADEYPKFSDISDDELIQASQIYDNANDGVGLHASDSENDVLIEATQEVEFFQSSGLDIQEYSETDRFIVVSDGELENRVRDGVPKNTLRRNAWAINTWRKWSVARNNRRVESVQTCDKYTKVLDKLENMNSDMLNYWLGKFIVEVRKENGEEYPPKTLLSLVMGLQSFLRLENKTDINFLDGSEFQPIRQVLDAEMKRISRKGIGSTTKKAAAFSDEEIDKLWQSKHLGDYNAKVLVRTILFLNGLNFGLRGGQEHRNLRYRPSQITLHEPQGQTAYLQYTEDYSKSVQGGLKHRRVTKKSVTHHGNPQTPERCHVRIYKKYMSLSPTTNRDDIFYLQPLRTLKTDLWYSRQAIGVNSLANFVKEMCKSADIGGHHTNHSLRATTATKLFQRGVDEQLIMARTGHRSVEGVRSYKRVSFEQNKVLSNILNGNDASVESSSSRPSTSVDHGGSCTALSETEEMFPNVVFNNCTFNMK